MTNLSSHFKIQRTSNAKNLRTTNHARTAAAVAADATDALAASEVVERERIDQVAATVTFLNCCSKVSVVDVFSPMVSSVRITDWNPVLILPVSLSCIVAGRVQSVSLLGPTDCHLRCSVFIVF